MTPALPDLLEYNCEDQNKDAQLVRANKPPLQPQKFSTPVWDPARLVQTDSWRIVDSALAAV